MKNHQQLMYTYFPILMTLLILSCRYEYMLYESEIIFSLANSDLIKE